MVGSITDLMTKVGGGAELVVLLAIFLGVFLLVVGVAALLAPKDAVDRRLEAVAFSGPGKREVTLRIGNIDDPQLAGLARVIAPIDPRQRLDLRRSLVQAGFRGQQALINFYLIRTILGLLIPMPLLLGGFALFVTTADRSATLPILETDIGSTMALSVVLVVVGFYGPSVWLRRRIAYRQQAIREGFPHALDMMQVAVDAGLGFDSALARVARELRHAHPTLAEEFAIVGLELRAGKSRDQVLSNLAERTGVDAIATFTTVIMQSISFGTSIAGALQVYAREMRHKRMMMAEELANQLPVKMSVVMVLFLLPTMFLVALSPVLIRLVRMFSGDVLNVN